MKTTKRLIALLALAAAFVSVGVATANPAHALRGNSVKQVSAGSQDTAGH